MRASDFEYDGKNLSDFGMIICEFNSKGLKTVSNGSQITFNTVSTLGGSKHNLVSTEYKECLETTIQICKNSCSGIDDEISMVELNQIMRWLCRRKYLKFKILDEDYIDLYFEAAFNISRIEIDGKLYGLELEVKTNRPFALKEPRIINIKKLIITPNTPNIIINHLYLIPEINNITKEISKLERFGFPTLLIFRFSPSWFEATVSVFCAKSCAGSVKLPPLTKGRSVSPETSELFCSFKTENLGKPAGF